jgi:hypothetical protein
MNRENFCTLFLLLVSGWCLPGCKRELPLASRSNTAFEQLDAIFCALDVKLSPDQIVRLDTVSAVPMGTPHEQISISAVAIAGGKCELLDLSAIPGV